MEKLYHNRLRTRKPWYLRQLQGLLTGGLLILALCPAPPAAGFLLSDALLTQCFGLDRIRPTRTVSSCNLIVPRSLCTEDQFTFHTHDGRAVTKLMSPDDEVRLFPTHVAYNIQEVVREIDYDSTHGSNQVATESQARSSTFTFYTYDGRAVTADDHSTFGQVLTPLHLPLPVLSGPCHSACHLHVYTLCQCVCISVDHPSASYQKLSPPDLCAAKAVLHKQRRRLERSGRVGRSRERQRPGTINPAVAIP